MDYDVIIAGGGPVGLFLACELALRQVAVLVLEKLADPRTPLKVGAMGGRGLNQPSVEALYRRGLLAAVRASALFWVGAEPPSPAHAAREGGPPPRRFGGHFAGMMLDANQFDFSGLPFLPQGPAVGGGFISLDALEQILTPRALALGAEVRLGAEIQGCEQDADAVTVHCGGQRLRARWLVGCDGGHSTVRQCSGFDFEGTDPELTGTVALAEIAEPTQLPAGIQLTPHGMYVGGLGPGRLGYIEFDPARRHEPVTLASFQAGLRRVTGVPVTVTALHAGSRYSDTARQATTYRRGRILLAGDAAHVHAPFGGQGLNLGLGDAMNLGWKLAATVQHQAPAGLLDTYTAERHPIGAWTLNWARAQTALIRPDPHARAAAAIVGEIIATRAGASFFAAKIAGLDLRYALAGEHPLTGRSAPDLELLTSAGAPTRLGDYLHTGQAVLLDLSPGQTLAGLQQAWPNRLRYLASHTAEVGPLAGLFVRPDGHVAWAADGTPDAAQAATAIARWLGPTAATAPPERWPPAPGSLPQAPGSR